MRQLALEARHTPADKNLVQAVEAAARQSGNRPATCRKYYIHFRVLEAYQKGQLLEAIAHHQPKRLQYYQGLAADEQRTLAILKAEKSG
ncbi:MAG: hypothetical protein AAGN15_09240 [Cyanobacteria bacterium J06581_3]